jgi:cellulose synthase/poly-beta-1,6-N-acetylglucosamine synthase-like glycosyltransferase
MIEQSLTFLFWASAALLAYVYVGYPILVYAVSLVYPRPVEAGPIEPTVTILITAFNEKASIRQKLENTLALTYPAHKMEIIVASDGSTDSTDDIVREFSGRGVKLFRQEGRVGKTMTQNNAVKVAAGDVILFSDATTHYPADVLATVLPPFNDKTVGCVAGRLVYVDDANTNVGVGAKSYWNYETLIKSAESLACSLIGASGCLYAVRRSVYEPMYAEACSDFLICTMLYRSGSRSVFAPEAVCYETTNVNPKDELRMRVRVISQTFTDLWRNRDMMSPLRSGFYAVQLISHKLLRYAVPLLLIAMFAASVGLSTGGWFYTGMLAAQTIFYVTAAIGWALERFGIKLGPAAIPLYFVLANLASAVGFYKFLRGERYARWEPIRGTR